MTVFLVLGAIGVALLVLALVVGDVFDGALDALGGGGVFSTEAIAASLGALGFGGAIALDVTGSTTVAIAVGIGLGLFLGASAGWLSHKLHDDRHTGARSTSDLIEKVGTVLSDIPADGYGTVAIHDSDHARLNARSSTPLAAGTTVTIVSVLSPTAVQVEPLFLP